MKKLILFSMVISIFGSIKSMNLDRFKPHILDPRIVSIASRMVKCRDFCTAPVPQVCVGVREFLEVYAEQSECYKSCPVSAYGEALCSLAEQERNMLIDCYQKNHNMTYDPLTQCEYIQS